MRIYQHFGTATNGAGSSNGRGESAIASTYAGLKVGLSFYALATAFAPFAILRSSLIMIGIGRWCAAGTVRQTVVVITSLEDIMPTDASDIQLRVGIERGRRQAIAELADLISDHELRIAYQHPEGDRAGVFVAWASGGISATGIDPLVAARECVRVKRSANGEA